MPEGTAVSKMFAGIATRYDLANHMLSGGVDYLWRAKLVRMVRDCNPGTVVDLATGSGDVAFAVQDGLGPGVEVVGLDFCEPMLEEARAKATLKQKKSSTVSIEFRFGDCMALPLADDSVDALTIAFGVRNFEDRERGLREMLRVLKRGGKAFILEFSQPFAWFRPFYYAYLKWILPWFAAFLTRDKNAYEYLGASIEVFPTLEALSHTLSECGFSSVKGIPLTFGIVAIHEAKKT